MALLVVLVLVGTGCAAKQAFRTGQREMRRENYDVAVLNLSKAVALEPGNTSFGVALERAKLRAAGEHFAKGQQYLKAMQYELAVAEFQQTLLMNPGHQHASSDMERSIRELRKRDQIPSEIEQLKESARRAEVGPPKLNPNANIPILLNFTDAEVGKIFEAIGKASGINFIFDEKTDLDKPMTIDIGNVTLEKALDILMLQTKNFFKVIDEYTLLVAPDTRQKRQEYEDQVIRTFFLSNADTKQVVTLLRSLLQSRQIAENTDLNSVTIKDTPDKVAIAERIINANDKSKGEVIIDVQLMEINRNVAKTLGIDLSSKALSLTFRDGAQSLPLNNLDVLKQSGKWTVGVIPSVILNFLKTDSDTKLVAKPQLRVSEGEEAQILIGDRVPIPTTSFNTSQTIGGNIVPITSFTYQNVGITVQLEPRVHHNKEVTLRVQVEISQVTGTVDTSGGQSQPIIGTRQIQTVIRLRDGETNMLAGLIQNTHSDGRSGIPGLMDIPGVGRAMSTSTISTNETDIIMTLTPRIIRIPDITEEDLATLWVGTEDNMRLRGPARNALNQSPFGAPSNSAVPGTTPPADSEVPENGNNGPRGTLSRITPSAEVERDREQAAARSQASSAAPQQASRSNRGGRGTAALVADAPDPVGEGGSTKDDEADDQPVTPSTVRLVPSAATYRVGDTVTVEVFIENAQNVGSVPFHLRYNGQVLQYIPPAGEGAFLRSDGTETVFLANEARGGGEVVVGLSRLGRGEGVTGAGSLASFQFLAVADGDCGFAFTGSSVKDPQARNLPARFTTVSVRVEP